jgi:hypothetical protein
MVGAAVVALAPARMMQLIRYKGDREDLAVVAEAEVPTNLVRRLRTAAILWAEVEAQAEDPLMVLMPQVEPI